MKERSRFQNAVEIVWDPESVVRIHCKVLHGRRFVGDGDRCPALSSSSGLIQQHQLHSFPRHEGHYKPAFRWILEIQCTENCLVTDVCYTPDATEWPHGSGSGDFALWSQEVKAGQRQASRRPPYPRPAWTVFFA
jgi:hypothetical protein